MKMRAAHSFERVSANRRPRDFSAVTGRPVGRYAVPIGGVGDASGTRPPHKGRYNSKLSKSIHGFFIFLRCPRTVGKPTEGVLCGLLPLLIDSCFLFFVFFGYSSLC